MKKTIKTAVSVVALAALTSGAQAEELNTVGLYDWTGFYAGAHLGLSALDTNSNAPFIQPNSTSIAGGGHAGYNFQTGNMVFGVEGDFSGLGNDKSRPCANPVFTCNAGAEWTASIRARAGLAVNRTMFYATGGVAFLRYDGFTRNAGSKFRDKKTFTGWTVGGGAEYAWKDNIIFGLEGSYSRYGRKSMNYDVPYSVKPNLFVARARVSFKF